jgi:hypothetical protein
MYSYGVTLIPDSFRLATLSGQNPAPSASSEVMKANFQAVL